MTFVFRSLVVVVLAGLVPGLIWLGATANQSPASPSPVATAPVPTIPGITATTGPVGMSGCAAAACHGSSTPQSLAGITNVDTWHGSAVHWLAGDPHSRAYAVLTSELGQHIMDLLRKGDPSLPVTADKYDRCLACHTNPALATPKAFGLSDDSLIRVRSEGVGCEACHGSAGQWLTIHTDTTTSYPPPGMADLNDIGERAKTCAGCHVGAPADEKRGYAVVRDMNHDMIAAGHPRLNFELTEYERRLPPHWFERDRKSPGRPTREPGFEARAWLVGRVAEAEAACELLADRAARVNPWPEFAEFNCFACHHTLQPESWRQTTPGYFAGRRPGTLPWQAIWPITDADQFQTLGGDATKAAASVRALQTVMSNAQLPKPETARQAATTCAADLAAVRRSLAIAPKAPNSAPVFRAAVPALERFDWDEAGQLYLGLAAVARSRAGPNPAGAAETDRMFAALKKSLALKRPTPETRIDSPDDYSPQQVRSDLSTLIDVLTRNRTQNPAQVP
jgi:hypothetical protein